MLDPKRKLDEKIDINLALKLYQTCLTKLFDNDWMGLNFYYYLKPYVRNGKIINCKTNVKGILWILGNYIYREFFYSAENDLFMTIFPNDPPLEEGDIDSLKGDKLILHLEYVYNAIVHHCATRTKNLAIFATDLEKINALQYSDSYKDNRKYFIGATKGKRKYFSIYNKVICDYSQDIIKPLEEKYTRYIYNQIFHYKELCEYIAESVRDLGLYGDENMSIKKYIGYKKTNDRIKAILLKIGQGKCAICNIEINKKTMTIDHIIPLSQAGHNDLVNLQATCLQCNHDKGNERKTPKGFPNIINFNNSGFS